MPELTRDEIALNAAAMALASTFHGPRKKWKARDGWEIYLPIARKMLRAHEAEIQMRPTCWECEIEQDLGYCRCEIAAND